MLNEMTNSFFHSYSQSSLNQTNSASWWQQKSIRLKTTILAIAIGTIPTIAIGSVAYYFAARSVAQETTSLRQTLVADLQNQVNVFMGDRLKDIEIMANLDIFTNPKLSKIATSTEKSAALQTIHNAYGIYNSIAVFNLQGEVIAQTEGKSLGNHLNRGYIQAALQADGAIISQPRISTSSGIYSIYTASPIKDKVTGKTIGFVRARMPVKVLNQLLKDYTKGGSQYYLLNGQGEVFLGSAGEYVIKTLSNESTTQNKNYNYEAIEVSKIFRAEETLFNSRHPISQTAINTTNNKKQFVTFAPAKAIKGMPALNWQAVIATDNDIVFAPQRYLRWVFLLGTGVVALGVAAIAYSLANRMLRPLLSAVNAVQAIGQGNFNVQLKTTGADELAQLGENINLMANRIQDFILSQTILAQQSEALKNITLQLANVIDRQQVLEIAVIQTYKILPVTRVAYYQFADTRSGKIIAESIAEGFDSLKDTEIFNPELIAGCFLKYEPGKNLIEIINNVEQTDSVYQNQLKSLGVKASLIAPIITDNQLDGLLIVHQYTSDRPWLQEEIEFISQLSQQIEFATTRLIFLEQQKQEEINAQEAKEAIQNRALSLLQEVYDVSEGNLTIRAKVTPDEIGTIADSYNSTIESLQKLVNQTKTAALEVQKNTSANDVAVQQLAQEAVEQAAEIAKMLEQVKAMEQSSNQVVQNAAQAENFITQAKSTIQASDLAINQTVAEINAVKNTVIETATKAEKLGTSSQEISQAVSLIGRFAAQTHLLALKASIEAARAGEQGKGFAVIADEVRSLATQSAEATAEIETLVNKIQLEANVLVDSMNQGTEQIAAGNELVRQTHQSLTEVSQVSEEISKLVSSITQAANLQSATSAQVSQGMVNVAEIAQSNSQSATQVSTSIKQLSTVAEKLQSDIDKFKT